MIPLVPPKLYSRIAWAAWLALAPRATRMTESIRDCVVDPDRMAPGTIFTLPDVGVDEYGDEVIRGICADGTPSTMVRLQRWRAAAPTTEGPT